MSTNTYKTPECIFIETEVEGVLCFSSFGLPGSNWFGEEEL